LDIYQVLDSATAIAELSKLDQVAYAVPVLVEPRSGLRAIPGDEIIVRLRDDAKAEDVFGRLAQDGLEVVEAPKPESPGHWLLRLVEPKGRNVLAEASSVSAAPDVAWAEPNLLLELEFYTIPNDQLFGRQQYLRNTGQNGALAGADIDAASVWDVTTGSGSIVIAILDTGVDTEHNDLKLNIFNNPNEKEFGRDANGVDDDANGYIDDWRGWDFGWDNFSNDNNPNPGTSASAAHGTACAGIAAAMGNNTFGTAGVAYGCKILPIKMIADDGLTFAQSWQLANAIS
jgi:subtilisin family serine protease